MAISLTAGLMSYLIRKVIRPICFFFKYSATSFACFTVSTMKQSKCGSRVQTTYAYAASTTTNSLSVASMFSGQIIFKRLAFRISLMIFYLCEKPCIFQFGLFLSCLSSCSIVSWVYLIFSSVFNIEVLIYFCLALQIYRICLSYLVFVSKMAIFSRSYFKLSCFSEFFAASCFSYSFRASNFVYMSSQILSLGNSFSLLTNSFIALILPKKSLCPSASQLNSRSSFSYLFISSLFLSLSLLKKQISRFKLLTWLPTVSPQLSTACSCLSIFPISLCKSLTFALLSYTALSILAISPCTCLISSCLAANSAYRFSLCLLFQQTIFFITRWLRVFVLRCRQIRTAKSPAFSVMPSKIFRLTLRLSLFSSLSSDTSMYFFSAASIGSLNQSDPEIYSKQSTIVSGESQQSLSTSPCKMINRFLFKSILFLTSFSLSYPHPTLSSSNLQQVVPPLVTLRLTLNSCFSYLKTMRTVAFSGVAKAERWMREARLSCLSLEDLNPKTNRTASMILDLPLPLGPIMQLKWRSKGPRVCSPLQLLKFVICSWWISIILLFLLLRAVSHHSNSYYQSDNHKFVVKYFRVINRQVKQFISG